MTGLLGVPTPPRTVRRVTERLVSILESAGRTSVGRRFGHGERLRRRLELAGAPVSVDALVGIKLAAASVAAVPLLLAATSFWPAALAILPVLMAASRVPDFVLARLAHRRRLQISALVPELVELLVATTCAGLSPPLALRRSAEILHGALGEEVRAAVRRLDLGSPWRIAMEELADRTGDASIRRLVRAMGRSQRLGAPLGSVLQNVAEDLRSERQAGAEERARRAPVKMLFPLVFLILPAFLLLTVGPVLLATIRTLR